MVPYAESIMLPNSFRVKCTLLLNKFQVTGICLWRLKEGIKSALYTQTHHCEAASLQSSFYTLIGAALATYFQYLVLLPLRANICTCSFLHWFTKVTTDCTTSVQRWNGIFFFFSTIPILTLLIDATFQTSGAPKRTYIIFCSTLWPLKYILNYL